MSLFSSSKKKIFLICLTATVAILTLPNLDNSHLWQDEAETALLAKSILTNGVPTAYDGHNLISQELGKEYDKNYIWYWTPWLQFYLTAGSFLLFGIGTFSARLPFALFGIASICVIYYLGRLITESERAGKISSILLAFCVPFLLYVRQCRYYSPLIFFTILTVYAYLSMRKGNRRTAVLFTLAAVFLFHTNYLSCLILLSIIALHWIIFEAKTVSYRNMLCAYAIILVVNVFWMVKFFAQVSRKMAAPDAVSFLENAIIMFTMIDWFIFPVSLLAVLALALMLQNKNREAQTRSNISLLVMIIFSTPLLLAAALPHFGFFRYLIVIIPFALILLAMVADTILNKRRILGIAFVVLVCFVNIRHVFDITNKQSELGPIPLVNYIHEVTHEYRGPIKGLVRYFHEDPLIHKKLIAVTHGDLPLKFYTSAKVLGGSTGEDLSQARNADYVVLRKDTARPETEKVRKYLFANIDFSNYEYIGLGYPDYLFENCPEPYLHKFSTPLEPPIAVYRRLD